MKYEVAKIYEMPENQRFSANGFAVISPLCEVKNCSQSVKSARLSRASAQKVCSAPKSVISIAVNTIDET